MVRVSMALLLGIAVLLLGLAAGGCAAVPAAAQQEPTPQATGTPVATATPSPDKGDNGGKQREGLQVFRRPDRGWLGIEIQSADGGVKIVRVVPDSPAAEAGLQAGDLVKQIDGKDVAAARDLIDAMASVKPGSTVKLAVQRGESALEVEVKAGSWPGPSFDVRPLVPNLPFWGWLPDLPGLEDLKGIPSGEAFEHFRGGRFTFADRDGKEVVVNLTPGRVTAVAGDGVTIDVNGSEGERTFKVDDETVVRPGGKRTQGLAVDDQVVVVTTDDSETAALIVRAGLPRIDLKAPRDTLERFFREFRPRPEPTKPAPATPRTGPRA